MLNIQQLSTQFQPTLVQSILVCYATLRFLSQSLWFVFCSINLFVSNFQVLYHVRQINYYDATSMHAALVYEQTNVGVWDSGGLPESHDS
jgi:hypothetical protein